MSMTERVKRLRQESLEAVPSLSPERARLMTEFSRLNSGPMAEPIRRARSFEFLLEHKTICINPGELIVGEKGPAPKAAPTYPELCCHSIADLEILELPPENPVQSRPADHRPVPRRNHPLLAG